MGVQLRLTCDSVENTESLHRWLRGEQPVRARGRLTFGQATDPADMGVLIEVLTLVVGAGLSAGQLAVAIAAWRQAQPVPPAVTITHTGPDGAVTRIEATTPEALTAAVRAIEQR